MTGKASRGSGRGTEDRRAADVGDAWLGRNGERFRAYAFGFVLKTGCDTDVVTYDLMIQNLIKEGLLQESDNLFLAMEKSGCTPDSCMLNALVRRLLHRGEIIRVGAYLSKIDEMNFSLEASTTSLLISVFSSEEYHHQMMSLPKKYHFVMDDNK